MATFPAISPDYGLSKTSSPNTRRVQFGDGYEQRLLYGLNQNAKKWSITWKNITNTEAGTIETFLDARASDGSSFDWTPPDDIVSYKWVCETWDKTLNVYNLNTITATFRQVFEP